MNIVKSPNIKLIHRNPLHFYLLIMENQKEIIMENIPFTIVTIIKHLGINLPKETNDLYIENYKTLMKEIKDDRNISCS